jgi:ribosome maturation factor RimP
MPTQLANQNALEALIVPVCEAEGVELVDVRHQIERGGAVLRVLIERPGAEHLAKGTGSVTLDDCTRVSRALSAMLDADESVIRGAYRLEVSSPGIERPLVKQRDFERFVGREAHVALQRVEPGQRKHFTGTLVGLRDGDVVLVDEQGEESRFPFDRISKAHLVYRF